jgi:hypothetical protein
VPAEVPMSFRVRAAVLLALAVGVATVAFAEGKV